MSKLSITLACKFFNSYVSCLLSTPIKYPNKNTLAKSVFLYNAYFFRSIIFATPFLLKFFTEGCSDKASI